MTTMTRTDIHRPSAPEFDPEGYECFGVFDLNPSDWLMAGEGPQRTVSTLVGMVLWVTTLNGNQGRDYRFEGACQVLHGKVHGDVCVKDDHVVLTRKQVK